MAKVGSRLNKSIERAVRRRRIFPFLAAATLVLSVVAAFVMTLVDQKDFPDMGIALWWAVVTLATVGYGDVVPTTSVGRAVGGLVILGGITFLAFLTATVTSAFVASDQSEEKAKELVAREAADKELKDLLDRLESRLDAIEEHLRSRPSA